MDKEDTDEVFSDTPENTVLTLAEIGYKAGVRGFICSPLELPPLVARYKENGLKFVTPGVRPIWVNTDDQKRVMTPAEAIKAGADYLVIGRPITKPPIEVGSPVDAVKRIIVEIEGVEV